MYFDSRMKTIPVRHITATLREQDNAGRFSIREVQDILNGSNLQHDLHRHNFFFILLLQKGKGIHEIDFIPYKVIDHSVFFLRPGQVHQLQLEARCTGYLLEFNDDFIIQQIRHQAKD